MLVTYHPIDHSKQYLTSSFKQNPLLSSQNKLQNVQATNPEARRLLRLQHRRPDEDF